MRLLLDAHLLFPPLLALPLTGSFHTPILALSVRRQLGATAAQIPVGCLRLLVARDGVPGHRKRSWPEGNAQ